MEKRLELVIDPSGARKGSQDAVRYAKDVEKAGKNATSAFENLSKIMSGIGTSFGKFTKNLNSSAFTNFNTNLKNSSKLSGSFATQLGKISDRAEAARTSFSNMNSVTIKVNKKFESMNTHAGNFRDTLKNSNTSFNTFNKKLDKASVAAIDADYAFRSARDGAKSLGTNLLTFGSKADKSAKSMNFFRDRLVAVNKEFTPLKNNASKIAVQLSRTDGKIKNLGKSFSGLSSSMKSAAAGLDTATKRLEQMDKKLTAVKKKNEDLEKSNRRVAGSFNIVGGAIAGIGFGTAVTGITRFVDSFTNIQNRLAVVMGSTTDLNGATRELLNTSIEARSNLDATVDLYSKLIRVNEEYRLSQEQLLSITETVSKSVAMSGASVQGAQGAMMQFSQALAGNFNAAAQELNSIIEQTPALARTIAIALTSTGELGKVGISDLKRLAKEGKITTDTLLTGLLNVKGVIDKDFNKSTRTMAQGWESLTEAARVFVGELDKSLGLSKAIAENLTTLARNFDQYKGAFAAVATAIGVLTAAATVAAIGKIIALLGLLSVSGAIVAGVAAIGAGIAYWATAATDAEKALSGAKKEMERIGALGVSDTRQAELLAGKINGLLAQNKNLHEQIAKAKASVFYTTGDIERYEEKIKNNNTQLKMFEEHLDNIKMKSKEFSAMGVEFPEIDFSNARNVLGASELSPEGLDSQKAYVQVLQGRLKATEDLTRAEQKAAFIKEGLAEATKFMSDATKKGEGLRGREIAGTKEMEVLLGKIFEKENKVKKATTEKTKTYRDILKTLDPLVAIEEEYKDTLKEIAKASGKEEDAVKARTLAYDKMKKARDELTVTGKSLKDITGEIVNQISLETDALRLNEKQLKEQEVLISAINKAKEEGKSLGQEQIKTLLDEVDAWYAVKEAIDENEKALEKHKQLTTDISNIFMSGIEAAMDGMDSFKDWFKNWLKDLALTALKNEIVIPISQQIAGVSGGSSGGIGGLGNLTSLFDGGSSLGASLMGGYSSGGLGGAFNAGISSIGSSFGLGSGFAASQAAGATSAGYSSAIMSKWAGGASTSSAGAGALSGLASAMPLIGIALLGLSSLSANPKVTFGQAGSGEGGFSFDVDRARTGQDLDIYGEGVNTKTYNPTFTPFYAETEFGRFGTLDSSFTKKQSNESQKAWSFLVQTLDTAVTNAIGVEESRRIGKTLSNVFLPEGFSHGSTEGERGPEAQIIQRYTEIFEEALPAALLEGVLSKTGETFEDFVEYVGEMFSALGTTTQATGATLNDINDVFSVFKLEGESVVDTLDRVLPPFLILKQHFETMGQTVTGVAVELVSASEVITAAAGGIENLTQAIDSYYNNFYTEEEKTKKLTEDLTKVFSDLGFGLPTTIQGFRDLMESIDLSNQTGQEQYGILLSLNPQVKEYIDSLSTSSEVTKDATEAALTFGDVLDKMREAFRKDKLDGVNDSFRILTESVDAQKDMLKEKYNQEKSAIESLIKADRDKRNAELSAISKQRSALNDILSLVGRIESTALGMMDTSLPSQRFDRGQAQGVIRAALSSGVLPSDGILDGALNTLKQDSKGLFGTYEDYRYDLLTTRYALEDLASDQTKQISAEQKALDLAEESLLLDTTQYQAMLTSLEDQYKLDIETLDSQLDGFSDTVDAINGVALSVDGSTVLVTDAIAALTEAISNWSLVGEASFTNKQISDEVDNILGKHTMDSVTDFDAAHREIGLRALSEGVSSEQLARALGLTQEEILVRASELGIPAFAAGGYHSGGLRLVGENGPELEYTAPSYISNNRDTRNLLDNSELVAEVRELRRELKAANYAVAKNTFKTSKILDRWDGDGQPEVRDYT